MMNGVIVYRLEFCPNCELPTACTGLVPPLPASDESPWHAYRRT